MKRILSILLELLQLLTTAGCQRPTDDTPQATPGSSLRFGSVGGFEWELEDSTLVSTGEGVLKDLFSKE